MARRVDDAAPAVHTARVSGSVILKHRGTTVPVVVGDPAGSTTAPLAESADNGTPPVTEPTTNDAVEANEVLSHVGDRTTAYCNNDARPEGTDAVPSTVTATAGDPATERNEIAP